VSTQVNLVKRSIAELMGYIVKCKCTIFLNLVCFQIMLQSNYLLKSYRIGARAFGVAAPKVWHDLPDSIRSSDSITSFKIKIKTYYNNQGFTSWLATYSLNHCDQSLNACLFSGAFNVDVNLSELNLTS